MLCFHDRSTWHGLRFLAAALLLSAPASAQTEATAGLAAPANAVGVDETSAGKVLAREGRGRLEEQDGQLVLYLVGSPYEMGYQHGVLLRETIQRMTVLVNDNPGPLGQKPEYQAYKALRELMHARLRPFVPDRFEEEMRGLAEGAEVPYEEVEAANLFPEAFHCSGMALMGSATHDGSLYHVRILDYMTEANLQEAALVIVHEPDAGHRWMNVGFAGFIGTVTGMNEHQISIGEMGGRGLTHWDGMPMAYLMRDALERASTLDEAIAIFRDTARTCEYYYVVSDAKIPDARGMWCTPDTFETMAPGEPFGFLEGARPVGGAGGDKTFVGAATVDVSDHRVVFRSGDGEVEGFLALPPEDCVILSGYDRYQHFVDRLVPELGRVDERALQEMIRRPVSMRENLHCAIFRPASLEAWVAVAAPDGSPACNQTYHRFSLAPPAPSAATAAAGR